MSTPGRTESGPALPSPPAGDAVAQVVLDLPLPEPFSYAVPPELRGRLGPGQRVRVPLRGRPRVGIVVAVQAASDRPLAPIEAVLDPVPPCPPALLALARWAARETASGWGEALTRALPPPARVAAPTTLPPEAPPAPTGPELLLTGGGRQAALERVLVEAREAGSRLLVLAPEVDGASALAEHLGARLGLPVPALTSLRSPRERWALWWAARTGRCPVAVGTRVAAALPLVPPVLVAVVEEHDAGHKAPDTPRWHVRELARARTQLEGGQLVLTSGAPSLETWCRARRGLLRWEDLPGGGWPRVERVDLRGLQGTCLTPAVLEAVRETAGRGRGILCLVHRLGYAPALGCAECGAIRRCPTCRVALTYHRQVRRLACRLCGTAERPGSVCSRCRGRRWTTFGWGTERVEAELRARLGRLAVARYDGAVGPARARAAREAFRAGRVAVVVGTSMAARLAADREVALAVVVDADVTLGLPDFRAGERTFQQLWHLAERLDPGGSLWVQSRWPAHPALRAVAAGDREAFYQAEWADRQAAGFPPARRLLRLLLAGAEAPRRAQELSAALAGSGLTVLGPARLPGRRWQLLVLGEADLPERAAAVLAPLRGRRRWGTTRLEVDVDPLELG